MTAGLRLRRIYLDKKELQENPYYKTIGIYYDVSVESALVYGPVGSAYEQFPFFFSVEFPEEYPLVPPQLRCCTAFGRAVVHPLLAAGEVVEFPAHWWRPHYRLGTALTAIQGLLCGEWPLAHDCAYGVTDLSMNIHYRNYVRMVGLIYSYSVASGERRLRAASAGLVARVRERLGVSERLGVRERLEVSERLGVGVADSLPVDENYLPYCLTAVGLIEKLRAVRDSYLNIKNTIIIGEATENAEVLSE